MKTIIDTPEPLLGQAHALAMREGVTLEAQIERALIQENKRVAPFKLRRASFGGKGLQPEFRSANWKRLRDEIY